MFAWNFTQKYGLELGLVEHKEYHGICHWESVPNQGTLWISLICPGKKRKLKVEETPTLRTRSKGLGWGTLQKEGLRLARNMHRICIEWVKDIWTTHGICTECWDIWWPHGICMVWRRRLEGLNKWNITNPRYKGAHHTRNCSFFAHSTCLTSQPINDYGVNLDAPKKKKA